MNIPKGDNKEDIKKREQIIRLLDRQWIDINPGKKKYNLSLKDYINIRALSIDETARHAAKSYLSTLAVVQLDAILSNAKKIKIVLANPKTTNQKQFNKMLVMEYTLPAIGTVRMIVGINRRTNEKIQYCVTAIKI